MTRSERDAGRHDDKQDLTWEIFPVKRRFVVVAECRPELFA